MRALVRAGALAAVGLAVSAIVGPALVAGVTSVAAALVLGGLVFVPIEGDDRFAGGRSRLIMQRGRT
jgi:hypothetical protein